MTISHLGNVDGRQNLANTLTEADLKVALLTVASQNDRIVVLNERSSLAR